MDKGKEEKMMYYDHCGMMGPWSLLLWFVFLAAVALIIYLVVRSTRQGGMGESPLDILKKRYARGEISKEEFEQKKRDLGL